MFTIEATGLGYAPFWFHVGSKKDRNEAIEQAHQFIMNNDGYVCVKDTSGKVIYGTDPVELDRAILNGTNKSFPRETARLRGYCVQ